MRTFSSVIVMVISSWSTGLLPSSGTFVAWIVASPVSSPNVTSSAETSTSLIAPASACRMIEPSPSVTSIGVSAGSASTWTIRSRT